MRLMFLRDHAQEVLLEATLYSRARAREGPLNEWNKVDTACSRRPHPPCLQVYVIPLVQEDHNDVGDDQYILDDYVR